MQDGQFVCGHVLLQIKQCFLYSLMFPWTSVSFRFWWLDILAFQPPLSGIWSISATTRLFATEKALPSSPTKRSALGDGWEPWGASRKSQVSNIPRSLKPTATCVVPSISRLQAIGDWNDITHHYTIKHSSLESKSQLLLINWHEIAETSHQNL